jgi:adenylosuccinate synthase
VISAHTVIGAGYGDEGKGLMTDYLASQHPGVPVVRFNGGSQAGHTVVDPKTLNRYVFHHIGSGSLAGNPTFLSRFFISNPMFFAIEMAQVKHLNPTVYADPEGLVTTPWDIMLNQEVEAKRGTAKHGSCGAGINETVTRSLDGYPLRIKDLSSNRLPLLLERIHSEYVPKRAEMLGVASTDASPWVRYPHTLGRYLQDVETFRAAVQQREWVSFKDNDTLIFEGAQGLQLDEMSPNFPHVSRSRTGVINPIILMDELGEDYEMQVYYMHRAYTTKHGAGPFPNEDPALTFEDPTNKPNRFQDTLRFAPLDLDLLANAIETDRLAYGTNDRIYSNLVMTCLDQLPNGELTYVESGRKLTGTSEEVLRKLQAKLPFKDLFTSVGPTRSDISKVTPGFTGP